VFSNTSPKYHRFARTNGLSTSKSYRVGRCFFNRPTPRSWNEQNESGGKLKLLARAHDSDWTMIERESQGMVDLHAHVYRPDETNFENSDTKWQKAKAVAASRS
jgi:hypothetical protein